MMNISRSFWATAISISLLSGCMKMDMTTTTEPALTIIEGTFTTPLSIPTISDAKNLTLEAKMGNSTIMQGKTTANALLYNAALPVLSATKGDVVNVKLLNKLTEASNIHWHGLLTPANMDGHPKDVAAAGSVFNYSFTVNQRAATTWFHPHAHMTTAKQVFSGLAGLFLVRDAEETALKLPSGALEIPLILSDKRFNADASLNYNPTGTDVMRGYLGDRMLVNNVESPFLDVKTRFYRFRAVNGSNGRILDLALSNGANFIVIGNDGGLLEKPVSLSHALLSPGERLDILIDFSKMTVGTEVFLQSNANTITEHGDKMFKILKFKVATQEAETFSVPQNLSTITPLSISDVKRSRAFALPPAHMAMASTAVHMTGMHTINGRVFSMERIDETVTAGETEIWEFDNSVGGDPHPMHIHGVQFQIVDRTGGVVEPYEKGWKDTVLVKKGEKVRVIMRFPNEKGLFLMHCHNLEHEDDGMMLNFEIK
ncbi:MAG: multicopper oxidase domain-containing protein [Saprospiraceae bacterium]|nr:multicopper oxidase domain-containing protein [Saprospiraceae bacterium]